MSDEYKYAVKHFDSEVNDIVIRYFTDRVQVQEYINQVTEKGIPGMDVNISVMYVGHDISQTIVSNGNQLSTTDIFPFN